MDYTPEQLEEKFNMLPGNVREALTSVHIEERLQGIGRVHKLHLDLLGELADETGLVMLGLTHPRDYVANLAKRLAISREEAGALAREVNEKIFGPIRESLKAVHGLAGSAATEEREREEIGGREARGRIGNGDLASLEERRERLIRGERGDVTPPSIHEEKLAGPVHRPPERIDLVPVTPKFDPYREPVEEKDTRLR